MTDFKETIEELKEMLDDPSFEIDDEELQDWLNGDLKPVKPKKPTREGGAELELPKEEKVLDLVA